MRSPLRKLAQPLLAGALALTPAFAGAAEQKALQTAWVVPPAAQPSVFEARPKPAIGQFFTINEVLNGNSASAPPQDAAPALRLVSFDPNEMSGARSAAEPRGGLPFGLYAFRAPDSALWSKWHTLQTTLRKEAEVFARCRLNAQDCTPAAARFLAIVEKTAAQSGRARYETVNQLVNAAIVYQTDLAQHGVADVWSAPLETFTSGRGDCEDYAIAKFVALKEAGMPADQLSIVLVRDRAARVDHAVLAVKDGDHWLILDNRRITLFEDRQLKHFTPLYAVDDKGVQMLLAPYGNASAQDAAGKARPAANISSGDAGATVASAPAAAPGLPFLL
jgi:predicted transglutaminase-like cysteine proteinase